MSRIQAILVLALLGALPAAGAKTRVAYFGLELDGSWSWIKAIQAEPDAELIAVADPNAALIARAKSVTAPSTRFYSDYVRMLDEVKPDAVLATVPNADHLAVTQACAQRRIHLWFQKPMAATAAQAREMARLARDSNILLMLSYHNLFNAPMQAVTGNIEAGQIGAIERLVMRNAFNASKVLSPTYSAQFLDPARHGGGALMDQGTYGINYAVYLMGRPARVIATAKTLHPRTGLAMEDEVWVVLDYPKATALINGGWWAHPDIGSGTGELNVSGTKGVILRQGNSTTMQQANDPMPHGLSVPPIPREMSGGVAHFIHCIRNHQPIHRAHGPEVNLIVAEIVDAAYESIRTGRAVALQ